MLLGGTVKELQGRMTLAEYMLWVRYRNQNGPMNDIRRYDRPAALVANLICRAVGQKNSKMSDFLPFGVREQEQLTEFDDFVKMFGR